VVLETETRAGLSRGDNIRTLFATDLISKFDSAARKRDRAKIMKLLSRVDLAGQAGTTGTILTNPSKYGY
jgi:hypothetical protein